MDGRGYVAVFTYSTRQLAPVMLITGWQVELLMRLKIGLVLTSFFYSVRRTVKNMVIN